MFLHLWEIYRFHRFYNCQKYWRYPDYSTRYYRDRLLEIIGALLLYVWFCCIDQANGSEESYRLDRLTNYSRNITIKIDFHIYNVHFLRLNICNVQTRKCIRSFYSAASILTCTKYYQELWKVFRRVLRQKDTKWRANSKGEGYNQWVSIIGAKSIGFIRTISVRGKRRGFPHHPSACPWSTSNPNEVFLAFIRLPLTSYSFQEESLTFFKRFALAHLESFFQRSFFIPSRWLPDDCELYRNEIFSSPSKNNFNAFDEPSFVDPFSTRNLRYLRPTIRLNLVKFYIPRLWNFMTNGKRRTIRSGNDSNAFDEPSFKDYPLRCAGNLCQW